VTPHAMEKTENSPTANSSRSLVPTMSLSLA
jgi:hypothetical protein